MARKARPVPLKIIRFSLDPMEPVEARILRRIKEIGDQLRSEIDFDMTQDEIDRYALKSLLADNLMYEASGARSAFSSAGVAPAVAVAPVAAPAPAPVQAAQEPVPSADAPAQQAPIQPVAPAVAEAQPQAPVEREETNPIQTETAAPATPPAQDESAGASWQAKLVSDGDKPSGVSSLLQGLSWAGEDS